VTFLSRQLKCATNKRSSTHNYRVNLDRVGYSLLCCVVLWLFGVGPERIFSLGRQVTYAKREIGDVGSMSGLTESAHAADIGGRLKAALAVIAAIRRTGVTEYSIG
jgi:hypothetical protein